MRPSVLSAILLCGSLGGRPLSEAVSEMPLYPQALENVRVTRREVPDVARTEVERLNAELGTRGRVLVRPSGTEPVIRVLAEAETEEEAANLCGSIAALVRHELNG